LLAERSDDAGRVERAYVLLFARPPSADEAATAAEYLTTAAAKAHSPAKAWESLARALFLSNEFVYVD